MPSKHFPSVSLLRVSGDDASDFLQGQLSYDVTQLADNWSYAAYCNPKGRVIALLQLWQVEKDFYALISSDLIESVSKRLQMFVLRSKVSIERLDNYKVYAIDSIKQLEGVNSLEKQKRYYDQQQMLLAMPQGYLWLGADSNIDTSNSISEDQWLAASIEHGLPQIITATSELFVPQMINLDLLGGISFKKGCYTGQEIVARMHYLGKLKQRLLLCTFGADKALAAGSKIINQDNKNIGTIVISSAENQQCLAVLRLDALDDKLSIDGIALTVNDTQPYKISEVG